MKIERLSQISILFIFILVFFYIKVRDYYFFAGYFAIGYFLFGLILNYSKVSLNKLLILFSIFTLFFVASVFSQGVTFYIALYNLQYGVISLLIAYLLVFKIKDTRALSKLIYFLYVLYLTYLFFSIGFEDDEAYNVVFEGSSRNYLSGILIFLAINVGISHEKSNEKQPLLVYIITFVCCYFLYGRSGILLSSALLLYAIYQRNSKLLIFLFVFSLVYFFTSSFFWELLEKIQTSSNFSRGFSSDRTLFLIEYLDRIDFKSIILGRNFDECCQLIVEFERNPHNSFITGHSRYGILHTLMAILILIYILSSRNLTLIVLSLIVYGRYFLDQMGLFTYFDVVLFQLLLLVRYKNNKTAVVKYSDPENNCTC
ncbi:hypothetical protein [Oligella urethralis]|uniref:hypothetical protein n=1 Tax=Oligella urethralis TaxID=90245 RepID=UPI000360D271|nr:hypothetical protein [Oligella urethralis]SUA66508.1 Uncharacterised protein [Oligella urethralis]